MAGPMKFLPEGVDEETRTKRRAELQHQVREEVRFAAAGRGMSLAEVSRRMGDETGRALMSNAQSGYSFNRLADIGLAMGVTFRLIAIPDRDTRQYRTATGSRPRRDRRFTPEQVREIRRRVRAGETHRALGKEYGVVRSLIGDIMRGEAYADVLDE